MIYDLYTKYAERNERETHISNPQPSHIIIIHIPSIPSLVSRSSSILNPSPLMHLKLLLFEIHAQRLPMHQSMNVAITNQPI